VFDNVPKWQNLDEAIKHYAREKPDGWAIIEPAGRLSWTAYDGYISLLAARLLDSVESIGRD